MVEESVKRTCNQLHQHERQLGRLLNREVDEIAQLKAPMAEKHNRMMALIEEAAALVAPLTPCKAGCSHCCKMAVTISNHEAQIIADHLKIEHNNPPMNMDRDSMVDRYMGAPCPFLKKGVCSIYEVRPLACRTHFNLSAYPQVCDVIEYPGNDVPNLDWRTVWGAAAFIHCEAEDPVFADLREFFPNGARYVQRL